MHTFVFAMKYVEETNVSVTTTYIKKNKTLSLRITFKNYRYSNY